MEKFGSLTGVPYDGYGVHINGGNYNIITRSVVVDATRQGFTIVGNNNIVDDCKAYGLDGQSYVSAMGYYFFVRGDNNIVANSHAERGAGLLHYGHGFIVKYNGTGNLFRNDTVVNMIGAYEARHPDVHHNNWVDCTALGPESFTAGITIQDGAHHNTFTNFLADGVGWGVRFYRVGEVAEAGFGEGNIIENSTFNNITRAMIYFSDIVGDNPVARSHIFHRNTFDSAPFLYEFNSDDGGNGRGEGNQFTDCTFDSIPQYIRGQGEPGATYSNSTVVNLGFELP